MKATEVRNRDGLLTVRASHFLPRHVRRHLKRSRAGGAVELQRMVDCRRHRGCCRERSMVPELTASSHLLDVSLGQRGLGRCCEFEPRRALFEERELVAVARQTAKAGFLRPERTTDHISYRGDIVDPLFSDIESHVAEEYRPFCRAPALLL